MLRVARKNVNGTKRTQIVTVTDEYKKKKERRKNSKRNETMNSHAQTVTTQNERELNRTPQIYII